VQLSFVFPLARVYCIFFSLWPRWVTIEECVPFLLLHPFQATGDGLFVDTALTKTYTRAAVRFLQNSFHSIALRRTCMPRGQGKAISEWTLMTLCSEAPLRLNIIPFDFLSRLLSSLTATIITYHSLICIAIAFENQSPAVSHSMTIYFSNLKRS
jgi:hypothetical protein